MPHPAKLEPTTEKIHINVIIEGLEVNGTTIRTVRSGQAHEMKPTNIQNRFISFAPRKQTSELL
jgi:hypothetical protein